MERFVAKVGGVGSADIVNIENGVYGEIMRSTLRPAILVCSAPSGITDLALTCQKSIEEENFGSFEASFSQIRGRFKDIVEGLGLPWIKYNGLLKEYKTAVGNRLAHPGIPELIMGQIIAEAVPNARYIDPTGLIAIDDDSRIDKDTFRRIQARLGALSDHIAVVPGYVGFDKLGRATTLRRNASDASASALAVALGLPCTLYKDTAGILSADPEITRDKALLLPALTFREAEEATMGGAYTVHEEAVSLFKKHAPGGKLEVRHYRRSGTSGTIIMKERNVEEHELASIVTGKPASRIIRIEKSDIQSRAGIIARIADEFREAGIAISYTFAETDSVTLTTEAFAPVDHPLHAVKKILDPDEITVRDKKGVVSIVGEGLRKGTNSGEVMIRSNSVLRKMGINPTPQSISEDGINYVVFVPKEAYEDAVRNLHEAIILDP